MGLVDADGVWGLVVMFEVEMGVWDVVHAFERGCIRKRHLGDRTLTETLGSSGCLELPWVVLGNSGCLEEDSGHFR